MFWVLLHKELLQSWRTHRLLILAVVLIAFGIISPVTARYMSEILGLAAGGEETLEALMTLIPEPTIVDSVNQYLKNLTGIGLLTLVLLVMGMVAEEKDKGTATLVLARPVGRTSFLLAKFASLVIQLAACLGVAALACILYTGLLFGDWLDVAAFLALNCLILLYFSVAIALTFLGSTLSRSSFAAAGIGLGGWLILGILNGIHPIGNLTPGRLSAAATGLALGAPFEAWPAVIACTLLVAGCLALSALVFQRQEL